MLWPYHVRGMTDILGEWSTEAVCTNYSSSKIRPSLTKASTHLFPSRRFLCKAVWTGLRRSRSSPMSGEWVFFACQSFDPDIFTHRALQKKKPHARTKEQNNSFAFAKNLGKCMTKQTNTRRIAEERERENSTQIFVILLLIEECARHAWTSPFRFLFVFACPRDGVHRFSSPFERKHTANWQGYN